MDPRQIEELLPFYALDALSEEEHRLVEDYLAKHPEARQELEQMDRAASAWPQSVAPVEPPRQLKEALMARVAADARARTGVSEQSLPARHRIRFENIFRALSLAAATIAVIWVVLLNSQVLQLRNELASLNQRLAAESERLDRIVTNLPQTNPVIAVSLKGTDLLPQALGQLIANPESQSAVLVISGLPRPEAGRAYQVWLIDDAAPVSAGLLTVDENGRGLFIVSSETAIGSFRALGISVEPEGGSPQPTGDIVVLSDL